MIFMTWQVLNLMTFYTSKGCKDQPRGPVGWHRGIAAKMVEFKERFLQLSRRTPPPFRSFSIKRATAPNTFYWHYSFQLLLAAFSWTQLHQDAFRHNKKQLVRLPYTKTCVLHISFAKRVGEMNFVYTTWNKVRLFRDAYDEIHRLMSNQCKVCWGKRGAWQGGTWRGGFLSSADCPTMHGRLRHFI